MRLECNYTEEESEIVGCVATSVEVKFSNETVTSISGTLSRVINYANIKTFKVEASPKLEFLPSGIEKFFPNLERLVVTQTALKTLTRNDLENFPQLRVLDMSDNQIELLEAEVFEKNKKIESIDLSNNRLRSGSVEGNVFKFTRNLRALDVSNNVCVNGTAENAAEVGRLKVRIIDLCSTSLLNGGAEVLGYLTLICALALLFLALLITCIKFTINK